MELYFYKTEHLLYMVIDSELLNNRKQRVKQAVISFSSSVFSITIIHLWPAAVGLPGGSAETVSQ